MRNILFVNCCIRGKASRTETLCRRFLEKHDGNITELRLTDEDLSPLTSGDISRRDDILKNGRLDDPMLRYAEQFASADMIVIGAPYWDLSFPSLLKVYIEHVTVCGVTFRYGEDGREIGMCAAEKLYYITTSGGFTSGRNFGYEYIKGLCGMYGIDETKFISAEGLDIIGADVDAILDRTDLDL